MLYQSINPATGEVVQTFPTISDSELEMAVATADACFKNDCRSTRARFLDSTYV